MSGLEATARFSAKRARRNNESRDKAANLHKHWTAKEDEILATWDQTVAHAAVLGEQLGRTIEACRQRFYQVLNTPEELSYSAARLGHVSTPGEVRPYAGWVYGTCSKCDWWGEVLQNLLGERFCEEC